MHSTMSQTLFSVVFITLIMKVNSQVNEDTPSCDIELAQQCADDALQAQIVTGCNWYRIVPTLSACLEHALLGCEQKEENGWQNIVSEFNATLQSDWCNPSCTDQTDRIDKVLQCFTYSGGQMEDLLYLVQAQSPPLEADCLDLSDINDCLWTFTYGCPALTDLAYDRISSASRASPAFISCGLEPFQQAPLLRTSVAALNPATLALPQHLPTTPATEPLAVPGGGRGGGVDVAIVVLLVLTSLTVVLLLLLIIIVTTRRRQAVHDNFLLRQWRPNGQKIYTKPHGDVSYLRAPTQAQNVFRTKQKYIEANGFTNDAVQLQMV